jgi:hypothetical protein
MPVSPITEPAITDTNLVYGFTYHIPDADVVLDTVYTVTINSHALDSAGISIGKDYRYFFFVKSAPSPYPYVATTPASPISTKEVALQLVLGASQSACDPVYSTSYTLSGQDIYLSYKEIQTDMACIMIAVELHPYGPVFNVGKLTAGEYRVLGPDSQFVGTFSVTEPVSISGTVLQMQDPAIVNIRAPALSEVTVTADHNPNSGYYYMPVSLESEKVTATTDINGNFTLALSFPYGSYKISAEKKGYYPQEIIWNGYHQIKPMITVTSDSLRCITNEENQMVSSTETVSFALLDTTQSPVTNLEVFVSQNGAAAESVYVYLSTGNSFDAIPMMESQPVSGSTSGARSANIDVSLNYSGITGKDGKIAFNNISLTPFVDYYYTVYGGYAGYASGTIRLNKFAANKLSIELPCGLD